MIWTLFYEFLKIGLFTFGGGYGMIPIIKETVTSHGWMNEAQFIDMIGLSEVTPGPIAINMATFVGNQQAGFLGALVATIGVVLPAFLIMLLIAIILKRFMKAKGVQAVLSGIKPVAIALITSSGLILLSDILFPISVSNGNVTIGFNQTSVFIFLLIAFTFLTRRFIFLKKNNPIAVIIVSAVIGLLVNLLIRI